MKITTFSHDEGENVVEYDTSDIIKRIMKKGI